MIPVASPSGVGLTRRSFTHSAALFAAGRFLHWRLNTNALDLKHSILYIGTYTEGLSKGIYGFRWKASDGSLTPMGLMGEAKNPSFLLWNAAKNTLYATSETSSFRGESSGSLCSYRIGVKGQLTPLNEVASLGTSPCFLSLDRSQRFLLTANFFGGSIACFALGDDAQIGAAAAFVQHHGSSVHPQRQTKPHPHSILPTPDNRHVLVADLGLDKILIYSFDEHTGGLAPAQPAFVPLIPGSGPRHMVFHPGGRFLYVINEISSTVTVFSLDARFLPEKVLQTLPTTPPGFSGVGDAAEIVLSPDGNFLYTTTRRSGNIGIFGVEKRTGLLKPIRDLASHGKSPFTCAFSPDGRWFLLANQASSDISLFRSTERGDLEFHGRHELPDPASFCFV